MTRASASADVACLGLLVSYFCAVESAVFDCEDNIHTRLGVVAMCRRETSVLSLDLMPAVFVFRRSALTNSPLTLYPLVLQS